MVYAKSKYKDDQHLSEKLLQKTTQNNLQGPKTRLDFAIKLFKHGIYDKYHLEFIENGNIKVSKLIIETFQDILLPQPSSQLSSSCL